MQIIVSRCAVLSVVPSNCGGPNFVSSTGPSYPSASSHFFPFNQVHNMPGGLGHLVAMVSSPGGAGITGSTAGLDDPPRGITCSNLASYEYLTSAAAAMTMPPLPESEPQRLELAGRVLDFHFDVTSPANAPLLLPDLCLTQSDLDQVAEATMIAASPAGHYAAQGQSYNHDKSSGLSRPVVKSDKQKTCITDFQLVYGIQSSKESDASSIAALSQNLFSSPSSQVVTGTLGSEAVTGTSLMANPGHQLLPATQALLGANWRNPGSCRKYTLMPLD
ncbi:unnamed protein product [Protopolystoma xenopodis]|uniref:Uncharacterized protein n=1 Tax=Protopolystoma xenopodis TaxID=117903 RepID=A0A3S5A5B2_9PLAT|nr:unnamed protein product [Protopolystoma xenopodis]